MDILDLARRHHTHAAPSSKPAAETSATAPATDEAETSTPAASTDAQSDPATTHHVSGGGRFMHFLQAFEDKHPEETKRILGNIADKLRSDAQHAGPWAARLERWADKLDKAADTGDMSNLMPTVQPHAHFGMRAYQKAQEAPDAGELEQVATAAESSIPAPASSTDAAAPSSSTSSTSTTTPAAPASSTDTAATSSSPSAQANTPIIPSTPAATDSTRMSA
jgi:hypothetical protein